MSGKSKISSRKPVAKFIDLLYMSPYDISAKDIRVLLQNTTDITVELWDEMNILELELANKNLVDLEPISVSFKNPSDTAFVKNRSIKTIFAVNLSDSDLATVISIFEKIISQYSGFLCADTEDFMPVYAGNSKK